MKFDIKWDNNNTMQELLFLSYRRGDQETEVQRMSVICKINQLEGGRDRNQTQICLSPELSPVHHIAYYVQ